MSTTVYYAGLGALMLLILTRSLPSLLPHGLAQKVAEDSEGFLLALVLAAWVQFVRPRVDAGPGRRRHVALGTAAVTCLVIGVWLYRSTTVVSSIKTLNETFLALAVLIPYVQLRRPLGPVVAVGLPALSVVLMLLAGHIALATRLAESLGMLVLVPVAFDVVDREVLEPSARVPLRRRLVFYAALLALPVVVSVMNNARLTGPPGTAFAYLARLQEAWVGVLVLMVYLAIWLSLCAKGPDEAGKAMTGVDAVPRGSATPRSDRSG